MTQQTTYPSSKILFLRYLKQKGIYVRFRKYFNFDYLNKWHPEILVKVKTVEDYFFVVNPVYYLEYAFRWDGTDEGFDFWSDLSAAWKHLCGCSIEFMKESIEHQEIAKI